MTPPSSSLSSSQKRLVRESFESLSEYSDSVVQLFYGRLFELAPELRVMFHIDMQEQSRKLLQTLTVLVDALDRFEQLRPDLNELGKRHAEYGVKPEHYPILVRALMWTFGHALGLEFDRTTRTAWEQLLSSVSAAMLDGAPATLTAPF